MQILTVCPGCSRHVRATDPTCPFCAAALAPCDAQPGVVEEEPVRLSRSAMLLAGAAMVAGCNLTQSAAIYGGPPPRPATDDVQAIAAIYGGPPQMFADASTPPPPPPRPPLPAYGAPPPAPPPPGKPPTR